MNKPAFSEEQLFTLGKTAYDKLILHCQTLEVSGFWDQAQQVMKQSSSEVLDLYVQAVLMKLAQECGEVLESQLEFIESVTCTNPLGISADIILDEELMQDVNRVYNMPPVLIQLFSLYDQENNADVTEYFIDALLNILRCMSYLNQGKREEVDDFIREYYDKVSYYITSRDVGEHRRYIRHKLENDKILCDVDQMHEEDERSKEIDARIKEQAEKCVPEVMTEPPNSMMQKNSPEQMQIEFSLKDKKEKEERERKRIEKEERERKRIEKEKLREEFLKKKEAFEKEQERIAKEKFLEMKQRMEEREREQKREQERLEREQEERIQALLAELDGLVGLNNVKEEIRSLINLIKIRKLRKRMDLPEMDMSYHMVFTGSPGTGKTTVARLVAKIYKELGILSEGNLVETDRSGLVAGYVGQTAIKVHEIVEQSIGGVLFIDEAYALTNPDVSNDFGTEAIDTLVKLMEDHRDNLVIIVAGYTEEMQNFLKSNTGLISRFNKFIDFQDYSKEELVDIMDVMAGNAGLIVDEEAKELVLKLLYQKTEEQWQEFGNARGIRNLFEKLVINQANRLVTLKNPERIDLIMIKKEDVLAGGI